MEDQLVFDVAHQEPLAQADKCADDMHAQFNRRIAVEHVGRLDRTVLGESIGQVLDVLPLL